MEYYKNENIDFEDKELSLLINELKSCLSRTQTEFARICLTVYNIWSYCKGNYFKAKNNEYYNSIKLLEKFGFDKNAVFRFKSCYEKFVVVVGSNSNFSLNARLDDLYKDFSPSKLYELLPLSQETIINCIENKLITPDMTKIQIRDYVKTLKEGSDKAEKVVEKDVEINEEEIPMAYNPKIEYEYSYFENKTKNQLLNIIWELQKEYQKLINKKTKKNDSNSKI